MKRLAVLGLAALAACADPTAPTGEYRMVTVCQLTIGDAAPSCLPPERCWLTYADHVFHCPSGDYAPQRADLREAP